MTLKKPDSSSNRQKWYEALRLTTLGWELALPIVGGALIGHYLDRRLETHPTFTLGLLALGVGVGVYNLWQMIRRLDNS